MSGIYTFTRQGRTLRTLAIVIAILAILIAAVFLLDAAPWLVAILALTTLPALWDLWRNPRAGLRLTGDRLEWHSGRFSGAVGLAEIDHMRFDTRWDFSVRISAVLRDGKRIRLPPEAVPPHGTFEKILANQGIKVKRHHFSPL